MKRANNRTENKTSESPVMSVILFLVLIFFSFWIINGIIQLFTEPFSGNKYSESEIQEQEFWKSQHQADEGARKAQEYDEEQKRKQRAERE